MIRVFFCPQSRRRLRAFCILPGRRCSLSVRCNRGFSPILPFFGLSHGETVQNARPELSGFAQYLFHAPSDIMEADAPSAPADIQTPDLIRKKEPKHEPGN